MKNIIILFLLLFILFLQNSQTCKNDLCILIFMMTIVNVRTKGNFFHDVLFKARLFQQILFFLTRVSSKNVLFLHCSVNIFQTAKTLVNRSANIMPAFAVWFLYKLQYVFATYDKTNFLALDRYGGSFLPIKNK